MTAATFRDAGPGDAAVLAALGKATFVETFGHLYRPEDLAAFLENHSIESWQAQLAAPALQIRIAEADGAPIAYAKIGPVALPVESDRPAIELKQFYILRPWQGKGLARPLMAWVIDRARALGARQIFLSVWSQNHRAQRFYKGYGFTFVAPYAFMVGSQADEDEIFRLDLEKAP